MSDTNTTPESAEAAPEPADTTPEPADTSEAADTKASREAAKYRRRLREVEAERDRLADQVAAMQKAEIERLSGTEYHVKGEVLWAAGYQVSDLIDDEGRPDVAKVRKAAEEAAERFGIRRIDRNGAYVPAEGKTPPVAPQITWGQLLHPNRP